MIPTCSIPVFRYRISLAASSRNLGGRHFLAQFDYRRPRRSASADNNNNSYRLSRQDLRRKPYMEFVSWKTPSECLAFYIIYKEREDGQGTTLSDAEFQSSMSKGSGESIRSLQPASRSWIARYDYTGMKDRFNDTGFSFHSYYKDI